MSSRTNTAHWLSDVVEIVQSCVAQVLQSDGSESAAALLRDMHANFAGLSDDCRVMADRIGELDHLHGASHQECRQAVDELDEEIVVRDL